MKLFQQEHNYEYDWNLVTYAFWFKYPNSVQKHIKNIDVINRKIDIKEKTFKLKRIIYLQYYIPQVFKNLFHIDGKGMAIEEVSVDLNKRLMTIDTVNHTMSPFIKIKEKCVYFQKDCNSNLTNYQQTTTLNIDGLGYMKSIIESTILNTIKEKSKQGINVMNDVIKRMLNENVNINNDSLFIDKVNNLEKGKKAF